MLHCDRGIAGSVELSKQFSDSQSLEMYLLMQYRHEPIHSKPEKSATNIPCCIWTCSFSFTASRFAPTIFSEIGAFVGGATIAAALGVRDSGTQKKLIIIEPGGSVKHKRLGTRNLRDLERDTCQAACIGIGHDY